MSADSSDDIPLETEPLVFFHPLLAGRTVPGRVPPVPDGLLLEEEPATWPQLAT
jgi:hypothetical protein